MDRAAEATLVVGKGIAGSVDRSRRRQVTLLESEAWAQCMAELGVHKDPMLRRANLLLAGVRLAHTRGGILVIGDTRLAVGGELTPCERMDEVAPGLQAALGPDWRGGVFAEVITGGVIRVGDPVEWERAVRHLAPVRGPHDVRAVLLPRRAFAAFHDRPSQPGPGVQVECRDPEAHTVTVRRFMPDDWGLYRDLRLRALHEAPDAFGSTYAHECQRADADWRTRLADGAASARDLPLVAEVNGEPSGLAWARLADEEPAVAHVYQMWVAPERRGHGVGRALLDMAVEWARTVGAHAVRLDVTVGNSPAVALYERAGFRPIGNPKPLRPGSALQSQCLQRSLTESAAEGSA